jgi:antitoxin MazE
MEIPVINIGNSKGIRLSKTILKRYSIHNTIELILEKDHLTIIPKTEPRKGWDLAFKDMHKNGDDQLLMDDVFEDESFEEWKI